MALLFPLGVRAAAMSSTSASLAAAAGSGTGMGTTAVRRHLKGVIFDMDGTLTVPCLDFAEMRRRVGVTSAGDILHEIEAWPEARKMQALATIGEMEREAKERLKIMPGAIELCEFLDSRGVRRGLITRNVKESVDHFHSNFPPSPFHPALSREFRPYKPSPGPLLHICEHWGISPHLVMMVGDSAKDDMVCGNSAGAYTCLLDEHKRYSSPEDLPPDQKPTFLVHTLAEVLDLLKSTAFELEGVPANS